MTTPASSATDTPAWLSFFDSHAHLADDAFDFDRDDVVRALLANPLVGQYPLAAELADELLAANREHLPRFFPS